MFSRSSAVTEGAVLDALRVVQDPDLHKDIVTLGFVKRVAIDGGSVAVTIELTTPACPVKDQLRDQAAAAIRGVAGVTAVDGRPAQLRPADRPNLRGHFHRHAIDAGERLDHRAGLVP